MQVGLCERCAWTQRIENDRGSVFWLCGKAKEDARFPKYPRLPVLACAGFKSTAPPPSSDEVPEPPR